MYISVEQITEYQKINMLNVEFIKGEFEMSYDMPGIKQRGTVITGCTDWFRPVIFKVERIEYD